MVFLYTTTYRGPGPYFFFFWRELRGKKTKEDGLLFPGVFLFIRDDRFFCPLPIFILFLLSPLRFFFFDWRRTVVEPRNEWGYFLRIQAHCG